MEIPDVRMKIGLVRHFKVRHKFSKKLFLSADEMLQWFADYDIADIESGNFDTRGVDWNICYTSPLERATKTARAIFKGEIIDADEVKELNVLHSMKSKLSLPLLIWALWVKSKTLSSKKLTEDYKKGIHNFIDKVLVSPEENVLIVSHVFAMIFLQKELQKRGFKGPDLGTPEHGKVYIFEK